MKKCVKISAVFACILLLCGSLAGCRKKVGTAYEDKAVGFQLDMPNEGDTVAILHTSMGDISLRFFPEAAPKTVKNFLTLSSQGYYNGLTFHRVISGFMIQGGDPKGDGTGGKSIYTDNDKGQFEDEFDEKLLNLRGAVAMANSGVDTNGSQFFINQATKDDFKTRDTYTDESVNSVYQKAYDYYKQMYGDSFTNSFSNWTEFKKANYQETYIYDWIPDEVWDLYEANGGNISLDGAWRKSGGHTVFAQVYAGMDIVDAIAKVEVDDNSKPVTDVVINTVEVTTYKK